MIVVPAIDLLGGQAVRLREGKREDATVYSDRPWELAAGFARAGAERVHIVDLDGAFAGEPRQFDMVRRILDAAARLGEAAPAPLAPAAARREKPAAPRPHRGGSPTAVRRARRARRRRGWSRRRTAP